MNAPMDDQRLDEILDRANAATKGPWCTDAWEIYQGTEYVPGISFWIGETCRGTADLEQDSADAAFIAAARTDVPELAAEVQLLRAERHSTNEALDDAVRELSVLRAQVAELEAQLPAVQEPENPFRPCGCPKRFDRHAWGCPPVPEDPHTSDLHHDYALGRDDLAIPRQTTGRCPNGHTFEDCTCGGAS